MEEMMITMMMISRKTTTFDENGHHPFSTSIPTWKLYENPFYTSPQKHSQFHNQEKQEEEEEEEEEDHESNRQIHRLHLPISTRKIAACFWDLTFIKPFMESELESARAQIIELKTQLEHERKARKKVESINKKLAKELSGERKGREGLEKVCEELAMEITSDKAQISRLKREMEEERKMLHVAEVLREERVQMKLSEAKILLEEKMSELEFTKKTHKNDDVHLLHREMVLQEEEEDQPASGADKHKKSFALSAGEDCDDNVGGISRNSIKVYQYQSKGSLEPENPHIKRGIKGFVEFPKVVRAIGSRSRHLGTKLECQKAQLMILLKNKSPVRSNNFITS